MIGTDSTGQDNGMGKSQYKHCAFDLATDDGDPQAGMVLDQREVWGLHVYIYALLLRRWFHRKLLSWCLQQQTCGGPQS